MTAGLERNSCRFFSNLAEKVSWPRLIKAGRTRTIHEPTRKKAGLGFVRVVSCDLVDRPTGPG